MKLEANAESSPKLKQPRDRLLDLEPTKRGSIEATVGEANPTCTPNHGTRHVNQGNITERALERRDSRSQLSYSVAKVFEPTKVPQERWAAELATSLESLERIEPLAAAALEPLRALCEYMRKLPYTYAPLRTFQEDVLAGSFVPMKALHQELALIIEESSAPFVQLAATDSQIGEDLGSRGRDASRTR
jgi:hypothetical protein